MTMASLYILQNARQKLENGWCRVNFELGPPDARRYCTVGAVIAAAREHYQLPNMLDGHLYGVIDGCLHTLAQNLPEAFRTESCTPMRRITLYNDIQGPAKVLDLFDATITALQNIEAASKVKVVAEVKPVLLPIEEPVLV